MANELDSVSVAAVAPRRRSRRFSRTELTVASWWRDLRSPRDAAVRARYSVDKARRFIAYANTTSRLRHVAVIYLYPLPGLLIALALALIPLKDPKLGVVANWTYFVHVFCVAWIVSTSAMVQAREVSLIDHREYGASAIVMTAIVVAALCVGFMALISIAWRFPIPFSWTITPVPLVVSLLLAHLVGFRGSRQLSRHTRTKLLLYLPSITVQASQLVIYPAYSALFAVANEWEQIVLVLLFPGIKHVLKRSTFAVSRHLGDFAREVAGSAVEIGASMYQATIMQDTPSPLVTASVIGLDVFLNIVDIKRYLDRRSIVPTKELLEKAFAFLIDTSRPPVYDHELVQFGTPTHSVTAWGLEVIESIKHVADTKRLAGRMRSATVAPSTVKTEVSLADEDHVALVHALEILQSAESIVLAEYLEVAVPFVSLWYLLVASQLPSAVYNPKLADFHFDLSQLRPAIQSILLYTVLQGLTFVGVYVIMRVRYRLSAFRLLAFVMETQTGSLAGKLTSWIVVILALPVVHYGMDFTFTFDFTVRTS